MTTTQHKDHWTARLGCDPGTGAPNLDDQSPADLHGFYLAVQRNPADVARQLFGGVDRDTLEATITLGSYATCKCMAMQRRKAGDIPKALNREARCERLYNSLPTWARW